VAVVNIIVWVYVPSLIYRTIGSALPESPLGNISFIIGFGVVITVLQVLGALTEGLAVAVPVESGASIASALYVWLATAGGVLSISSQGIQATLEFRLLVYLLVLSALFNSVRIPLGFLLDRSEAGRPSPDEV